jgi:hypothetical protein
MWRCLDFPGALPYPGGLLSQPAGLIEKLITAFTVWQAVRDWRRASNWAAWSERNPGQWRTVQAVIVLRDKEERGLPLI